MKKFVTNDCTDQRKIGVIAQEGANPNFALGAFHVIGQLLRCCDGAGKYQVFNVQNAGSFVAPLVRKGIDRAILEHRYKQKGYYQIKAEPIIDGMLKYSDIHPDTEFVMVMRDSIYAANLNYFLGVNSKRLSPEKRLLNSTIISCGKDSPFAMDPLTFQTVLMHELGHRFGATDYQNRNSGELYDYPQLGTHCTTPGCIMNVANSLDDAKRAASRRATYCPACLHAMKKEFSR